MMRHAVPYTDAPACPCQVQPCGGIIPDPDCPHHGARKSPAMEWHQADGPRCQQLKAGN
jgi:hypothetical protein